MGLVQNKSFYSSIFEVESKGSFNKLEKDYQQVARGRKVKGQPN